MRIDFINFVESPDESISYPMGILYLSAYLKEHGFTNIGFSEYVCLLRKLENTETFETKYQPFSKQYYENLREENQRKLITYLNKRKPHIILLGPVTTNHLVELVHITKKLREKFKKQTLIAGGPHFGKETNLDKELLEISPEIDGIAIGEAEETIIEIANRFYSKYITNETIPHRTEIINELSQIPGVLTRINDLQERELPSLENMLLPDLQLLEEYWKGPHVTAQYSYKLSDRRNPIIYIDRGYFQGEADWGSIEDPIHRFSPWWRFLNRFPFGVILGSRGCPYHCTFCASSGERRIHTARYIFELISFMNQKYDTEAFVFFDSLFTTSSLHEQERVLELCNFIKDAKMEIGYLIEIRADVVNRLPDDVLTVMIQSGCVQFNLGLEKGSDQALHRVKKGTNISLHFSAVRKLRRIAKIVDREIFINGSFILGGPGETKTDVREAFFHSWYLHIDAVSFYIMNIFPGTIIYDEALKEGKIKPGLSPFLDVTYFPEYISEEIPSTYLNEIIELNDNARNRFNDFKNTVKELELQFIPREKRVFSNIIPIETGKIIESFYDYVDKFLDLAGRFGNPATWDNNRTAAILIYELNLKNRIIKVEEKLIQKYPQYDPEYGDYHQGSILGSFLNFKLMFMKLLEKLRLSEH